jgi:hypothetical protein
MTTPNKCEHEDHNDDDGTYSTISPIDGGAVCGLCDARFVPSDVLEEGTLARVDAVLGR